MNNPADKAKVEAVKAVISNVHRLLADAELLLEKGSAGSALSLAILAFEEAGKGHVIELGFEKPRRIRSHHEFRHAVSLLVLGASLTQKYEVDIQGVAAKLQKLHDDAGGLHAGLIPAELRAELHEELLPQLKRFDKDDINHFGIEMRWLMKIADVVDGGGLEKLRQSGLYLDADEAFRVTSSPEAVAPIEAARWLWAAGRVLNLLEHGAYKQSYTPLSELIAAAASGDKNAVAELEALRPSLVPEEE